MSSSSASSNNAGDIRIVPSEDSYVWGKLRSIYNDMKSQLEFEARVLFKEKDALVDALMMRGSYSSFDEFLALYMSAFKRFVSQEAKRDAGTFADVFTTGLFSSLSNPQGLYFGGEVFRFSTKERFRAARFVAFKTFKSAYDKHGMHAASKPAEPNQKTFAVQQVWNFLHNFALLNGGFGFTVEEIRKMYGEYGSTPLNTGNTREVVRRDSSVVRTESIEVAEARRLLEIQMPDDSLNPARMKVPTFNKSGTCNTAFTVPTPVFISAVVVYDQHLVRTLPDSALMLSNAIMQLPRYVYATGDVQIEHYWWTALLGLAPRRDEITPREAEENFRREKEDTVAFLRTGPPELERLAYVSRIFATALRLQAPNVAPDFVPRSGVIWRIKEFSEMLNAMAKYRGVELDLEAFERSLDNVRDVMKTPSRYSLRYQRKVFLFLKKSLMPLFVIFTRYHTDHFSRVHDRLFFFVTGQAARLFEIKLQDDSDFVFEQPALMVAAFRMVMHSALIDAYKDAKREFQSAAIVRTSAVLNSQGSRGFQEISDLGIGGRLREVATTQNTATEKAVLLLAVSGVLKGRVLNDDASDKAWVQSNMAFADYVAKRFLRNSSAHTGASSSAEAGLFQNVVLPALTVWLVMCKPPQQAILNLKMQAREQIENLASQSVNDAINTLSRRYSSWPSEKKSN